MSLLKVTKVRPAVEHVPGATKVPEITAAFWILKLISTAMGESASDYLLTTNPVVGLPVGVVGLAAALWVQFRARRYHPVAYWAAVAMVAVFGTMIADVLKVGLGVPLVALTVICAVALAATFLIWHRSEGTLSIHSITSRRREAFYWLTVSFTFALGTAAGDLTADTLGLGYLGSIVLFAVIMAVPVVGHYGFRLNAIVAFWFAYVITRPLGASIADWLAKPAEAGGVGWGDGWVAMILFAMFAVVLTVVALKHRNADTQPTDNPEALAELTSQ